jgi:hypothetical protein
MYNLTDNQKDILRWLVKQVRNGSLPEEFHILWSDDEKAYIFEYIGEKKEETPIIKMGALDSLAFTNLILCNITYETKVGSSGNYQGEKNRRCTLLGKAYEAVDTDFNSPDLSFIRHLTPLADITNLDSEIKQRCLPILGAGSNDPKLWDSVVRTAGVLLEERLRSVGGIVDTSRTGRDLVNDVFGNRGTLIAKIPNDSERLGYRDMYAGIFGLFRNPYAHRLLDPTPEDGGSFLIFINLLLKMLEDLR